MSVPLIRVEEAGVKRGARWIIRNLNLAVDRGQFVYVIGANGAGKSTCIKAALGLIELTEGSVERDPSIQVGYVPQRLAISPNLPLTLRRLMSLTGKFAPGDVDDALRAVGLEKLGDPPVTTLSGGEFQRLLLARALIHKPDLLVLDEPAQGVDVAGAEMLQDLIIAIRRDLGCGVLMVSHDIKQAFQAGDDFVVLIPHEHDTSYLAPGAIESGSLRGNGFQGT